VGSLETNLLLFGGGKSYPYENHSDKFGEIDLPDIEVKTE